MVINGSGKPQLIILSDAKPDLSNPESVINLPFCEKLIEVFEPVVTRHNVQRGVKARPKYVKYSCTLDYSGFIDGQTLLDIAPGLKYSTKDFESLGTRIVLVPRIDSKGRNYNVILTESIDMSLIPNNVGHTGVKFEFEGTDFLPDMPIIRTGYGSQYGSQTYNSSGVLINLSNHGSVL